MRFPSFIKPKMSQGIETTPASPANATSGILEGWTPEVISLLLLRIWIGLRLLIAGFEKFQSGTTFSFENYHTKMGNFVTYFAEQTILPGWLATPYCYSLGYLLITFGFMVLMGVRPLLTYALAGLMFISLSFGLMLDNEASGVAWLGIHMILTVMALMLAKHNRFAILG